MFFFSLFLSFLRQVHQAAAAAVAVIAADGVCLLAFTLRPQLVLVNRRVAPSSGRARAVRNDNSKVSAASNLWLSNVEQSNSRSVTEHCYLDRQRKRKRER